MKKLVLFLLCFFALSAAAQVSTDPEIIPVGYTGRVTITFDPTKGDKGMITAAECYLYSCIEVDNSGEWEYQLAPWPSKTDKTRMTKNGNKWEIVIPNLYTFYGVPSGKTITKILVLFTDGGNKSGRGADGNDIVIVLGEEISGDIWENFTPQAVVNEARPSGIKNGIYYDPNDPTVVTLCTYAASKTAAAKHVYVVGDMTNWKLNHDYQLKKDNNYFWIKLTGLEPGKEYRFQYAIERADGEHKQISDLYSEKVVSRGDQLARKADPSLIAYPINGSDGGYVTVIQPGKPAFQWSDATLNFKRPNKDNLIIYELWAYDHTGERTLAGLTARMEYFRNLGINAIELMPMCEFEYPDGWGYSPTHYFASHKACGSSEQLKTFIDECHKNGIAVIIDMVLNHATGLNPMNKLYPLAQNPWFNVNPPHGDNVFEDWNHDFEPAHDMFMRVFKYWLNEYKVDGFRLDLSHGLCGPTDDAVENLKDYYNNGVKAVSPDAYMILEHWGKDAASRAAELADEGMMPWAKFNYEFAQVAMGYTDGSNIKGANKDNYISYAESHDEERNMAKVKLWGAGNLHSDEAARVRRAPLVVGLLTMLDGPKMLYHYEELGFDYSKYQDQFGRWGNDNEDEYKGGESYGITPDIEEAVKMYPKHRPELWIRGGVRMESYCTIAKILQLRTRIMPAVFEGDPTDYTLVSGLVRSIQWGSNVYVAGNMSATDVQTIALPSGTWYDYLAGGVAAPANYTLQPGEIKVFTGSQILPPVIPASYEYSEDIDDIIWEDTSSAAFKIIRNGQVLIVRDNMIYDLMGRRIQ